jgi:hypothetical protein
MNLILQNLIDEVYIENQGKKTSDTLAINKLIQYLEREVLNYDYTL